MAGWRPLKRRDFIRKLRALGFDGPFSGTRHQFMISGQHRQTIPTNSEYSVPQVRMLIRQVESILGRPVALAEWDSLEAVEILNDPTCIQLMRDFIRARPELWNEDIGV